MSRFIRTRPAVRQRWSRRELLAGGAAALGGSIFAPISLRAQQDAAISTFEIADLFVFQGAGANVIAMPGADGALMIDGGLAENADRLLDAVYAATGNDRIDTLINTHWHPEQTGANVIVGNDGGVIFAHEKTRMYLGNAAYSAVFDGRLEPLPESGRPTEVTRGDGSMEFDGHRIDYGYLPAAHTDGDLYIHFPESNVLAVGGVLSGENWPLIDYRAGAWYGGRVRAAEWLAELVEPDTQVVPADGRTLTGRDVVRQRDIYQELFTTMIEYMNRGFGPEDAVASNPLEPYQDEFGDPSAFLDGAYRSMLIAYVPD